MCNDLCAHCGPCEASTMPYPQRWDWHDAGHPVEVVSVQVVPPKGRTISEAEAIEVAPALAGLLYPERRFGRVMHVEPDGGAGFYCAVEVNPGIDPNPRVRIA